ncbi:DUF2510 domain-containing protein [Paenarthrobacter nitroguajacolicus]
MELKSVEGRATLTDSVVTLTFDNKLVALPAKRAVSPREISLRHVLEVDFLAPTTWKPGYLRIIMREGQARVNPVHDTYTVQLGAGRRLKEAQEFVAQLKAAVDAVQYETPEPSTEAVQEQNPVSFKDVVSEFREAGSALDDFRKSNVAFRGFRLAGRTLHKGNKSWPSSECEVVIDVGANVSARVTGTRIAAGALLGGTTGALIGSIAKKDRSALYLTVITPDDMFIERVAGLDEKKARDFAMKVKRACMLQEREAAEPLDDKAEPVISSTPVPPPPGVPAGWYPNGDVQRYWDGTSWTEHTAPLV